MRQEAFAALAQQEQARVLQQEQDRAQAEAMVNQIRHEAHGVINQTTGALNREQQERMRMEAEERKTQQAEQNAKNKYKRRTK